MRSQYRHGAGALRTERDKASIDPAFNVDALASGERGAWERFVRRYAPVIHGAVLARLTAAGLRQEAADVVQEVFLRLCRDDFAILRRYDPARSGVATWLTVIATSMAIDFLRRRRLPAISIDAVPEEALGVVDAPLSNEPITLPPGLLTPRQSLVMSLIYDRDLDVAEIAAMLKIDAQTVRSTHHKALERLRRHFGVEPGEGGSK